MQLLKYLLLGLGKPNLLSSQCCVWGVGENFLFLAPPYLCKSLSFLTNALWSPLLEMEISGLYSLYFSHRSAMAVGRVRAAPPPFPMHNVRSRSKQLIRRLFDLGQFRWLTHLNYFAGMSVLRTASVRFAA